MTGSAAARSWGEPRLRAWRQVTSVSTSQTQLNFTRSGEMTKGNSWSSELVRQSTTQPWRIYSQECA